MSGEWKLRSTVDFYANFVHLWHLPSLKFQGRGIFSVHTLCPIPPDVVLVQLQVLESNLQVLEFKSVLRSFLSECVSWGVLAISISILTSAICEVLHNKLYSERNQQNVKWDVSMLLRFKRGLANADDWAALQMSVRMHPTDINLPDVVSFIQKWAGPISDPSAI